MGQPFPESVAFERSHEPFPPDATPSMKLRRALLHGRKVSAVTAEQSGATKSLVYVLVRTMRDWGFEIDQGTMDGSPDGETCYWITNLDFVPTDRIVPAVRRPYEAKPKVNGTATAVFDKDGIPEGIRVHNPMSGRAQIIKRLARGDLLTAKMVKEQHDVDATMLRKAIAAYFDAGYHIDRTKIDGALAYGVDLSIPRRPQKAKKKQASRQPTRAVERAVPTVPMATSSGVGGDWAPAVNGLTPVPHLDEGLVVFLTHRDDDGAVMVGIRNGNERWLCRVEGHVDVNALSPG